MKKLHLISVFATLTLVIVLSACAQNAKEEIQFQGFDYNDNYQLEQMSIARQKK